MTPSRTRAEKAADRSSRASAAHAGAGARRDRRPVDPGKVEVRAALRAMELEEAALLAEVRATEDGRGNSRTAFQAFMASFIPRLLAIRNRQREVLGLRPLTIFEITCPVGIGGAVSGARMVPKTDTPPGGMQAPDGPVRPQDASPAPDAPDVEATDAPPPRVATVGRGPSAGLLAAALLSAVDPSSSETRLEPETIDPDPAFDGVDPPCPES